MVQEKLVTLENAKKLKELGFNDLCDNCNKSLNENIITFDLNGFSNSMKGIITRPTQCHVQRWLFKRGYFVSTSFAFKEFDKEAEDCDNAKMLYQLKPEVYRINEIHPHFYERIFIDNDLYSELKSADEVLEDAINIVLDVMLGKEKC